MEPEAIRVQLQRILNSQEFAGVLRLQRFLSFVVETSLEGRSAEIKETLVAVEVYGRPPDYNPQMDASVRVEAGRLRARLRRYYEGPGRSDEIEITLPRGTYSPSFERRPRASEAVPAAIPASHTTAPGVRVRSCPSLAPAWRAALAAALVLAGCGASWLLRANARQRAWNVPDPASMELYFRARQLLKQPKYSLAMDGPVPDSVLESVRLFEKVTR
jgi:hypothetical protein